MSIETWLQKKNENIHDMRKEMLAEAYGFKTQQGSTSWWRRNQVKIIMYTLFITSMATCYYYGWIWPLRILGIMLALMLWRKIWNLIKKGYNILKAYLAAKKLLKQISALKKE